MSDSAQNVEIEDVLSSIRRLVSGDEWVRPATSQDPEPATQHSPQTSQAGAEKFVLTPVLRVVAPEAETADRESDPAVIDTQSETVPQDPQGDAPELAQPDLDGSAPDDPQPSAEFLSGWGMDDPILDLSGEGPTDDDSHSDDGAGMQDEPAPADTDYETASTQEPAPWPMAEGGADAAEPEAGDVTAVIDAEPNTVGASGEPAALDPSAMATADNRLQLEATIAELEAAVAEQAGDFEPDGSEEVVVAPQEWVASAARRTKAGDIEDAQVAVDEIGPEEEVTFHHIGQDYVADETLEELGAGLSAGAAAFGAEMNDDLNAYLEQDSVIDEQMLRDLVADIVRQELQGALGERITRNVRKLVRREIYRVLASQEFD